MRNVIAARGGEESDSNADSSGSAPDAEPCERIKGPRCSAMMTPDNRHAVGCAAQRNTRHNAVRDVVAEYVGEAGKKCKLEQSFVQLARMTGRDATEATRVHRDSDDDEDVGKCENGERPCDIVILHRISDAPTTVIAYDVTMALPDSSKGVGGMRAHGGAGPDWQRAIRLARARKEKNRGRVQGLGAGYEPLVLSSNGRPDEETVKVLAGVAKDWALAHGCSPGDAMKILRVRISCATHRWNGEILKSLCTSVQGKGMGMRHA
jgi:hypothetical protein